MQAPEGRRRDDGQATTAVEPWLDTETAIGRLLGNKALYFSMLELFRVQLVQDMQLMQSALGIGNQKEALRLLHSTKGAARILGAERLASFCDQAYGAVVYGETPTITDELAALLGCAAETLTHIDQLMESQSA